MSAAKPATNAPIKAVAVISKAGLSIFKINKDTLCASIWLLLLLKNQANDPHNKNNAIKPARKDLPGFCGINADTKNAATTIDHQGRYKQAATLSKAISNMETKNLIIQFY